MNGPAASIGGEYGAHMQYPIPLQPDAAGSHCGALSKGVQVAEHFLYPSPYARQMPELHSSSDSHSSQSDRVLTASSTEPMQLSHCFDDEPVGVWQPTSTTATPHHLSMVSTYHGRSP
jgi:hypothetical protein